MQSKTGIPHRLIALPVIIWTATLVFGTLLLLLLLNAQKDSLIVAHALKFILLAAAVNIAVLLFMVGALLYHKDNQRPLVSGIILMLSNIPIAFIYFNLLLAFAKFLR